MTGNELIPGRFRPPAGEDRDGRRWRQQRLLAAGFPPPLAARLAGTPGTDVHALLGLIDRGCPPELAARILG